MTNTTATSLGDEQNSSSREPSPQPVAATSVRPTASLATAERHELECLRHRVQQLDYPCSPHCDGYLREQALQNTRPTGVRLESGGSDGRHLYVILEYADGHEAQLIHDYFGEPGAVSHWARISTRAENVKATGER